MRRREDETSCGYQRQDMPTRYSYHLVCTSGSLAASGDTPVGSVESHGSARLRRGCLPSLIAQDFTFIPASSFGRPGLGADVLHGLLGNSSVLLAQPRSGQRLHGPHTTPDLSSCLLESY
eukprot:scaffold874_cov233-Pinguiococcus_pyrenoidosus.AAC.7